MYLIFILTMVIFSACNEVNKKSNKTYQTKFVKSSKDNKIEILNFEGTRQPILF